MAHIQRPSTPDSPMHRATNTIDDLTLSLSNFSRGSSPMPQDVTICCCGKEDCPTSIAWQSYKAKLESKLVLSAEVGQALLERHEAYVRRHELSEQPSEDSGNSEGHIDSRVADLVKENAVLERRLAQALVTVEIAESSNKTALQELEEARAKVSRLTAQQARSVGLETRLSTALQERDDLHQERDSANQRERLAETRISALREKCAKLQAQVVRLREDLDLQRTHRRVMSQEVLQDARQRLAQLQQAQLGHSISEEDVEVTKVLESLVADNEALKRDNAELQNLLGDAREDVRALQEEVEERRANDSSLAAPVVGFGRHKHTTSAGSLAPSSAPLSPVQFHVGTAPQPSPLHSMFLGHARKRSASVERTSRRPFEPLTPETEQRALSPTESTFPPSEMRWTAFPRLNYPPSHHSYEIDDEHPRDDAASPERTRAHKSMYLLTRSRGVQTDGTGAVLPASLARLGDQLSATAYSSPNDGQSESSSINDVNASSTVISALLDRIASLLNRLSQADALTLTNRLKRQHLVGADVSHLSRTTVSGILAEAASLRAHFRSFLEDDKITTTCTRRDLRALLRLVKDIFTELGQMRVTLNDVILDPALAAKVSEMALHPANTAPESPSAEPGTGPAQGWMAPISKLLGLPGGNTEQAATRALSPPARPLSRGRGRVPSRIVPKREAALSASAMTVNVEFTGTAVGRSVTSTYSAHPEREDSISILALQGLVTQPQPASTPESANRNLMQIFAGAPKAEEGADPWVVIPNQPQRGETFPGPLSAGEASGSATIGRKTLRRAVSRIGLARAVDNSETAPGADRTLKRRGLSDSSIHTTYMQHGEDGGPAHEGTAGTPDGQSMLTAISRRMQSFRFAGAPPVATTERDISRPGTPVGRKEREASTDSPDRRARTPTRPRVSAPRAIPSGRTGLLQTLTSSWAAVAELNEDGSPSSNFGAGFREETHRTWNRDREY